MARNKHRPIPGMSFPRLHREPVRTLLRDPQGIQALHEASHAVVAALLDTPGFESVDIKIRTRETDPNGGIPAGVITRGSTLMVWPAVITKGCAWKRALGVVAPGITAQILHYQDRGIDFDLKELMMIGEYDLGIGWQEVLRVVWRLTEELVQNICVFTAIFKTASGLLHRGELSADEVRGILKNLEANSAKPIYPLSAEVQELIGITDQIENHEQMVASRVPSKVKQADHSITEEEKLRK
jgi:hypothetical protein